MLVTPIYKNHITEAKHLLRLFIFVTFSYIISQTDNVDRYVELYNVDRFRHFIAFERTLNRTKHYSTKNKENLEKDMF